MARRKRKPLARQERKGGSMNTHLYRPADTARHKVCQRSQIPFRPCCLLCDAA